MGTDKSNKTLSTIAFAIAGFFLTTTILTCGALFGYLFKLGFENRERIVSTETCLISVQNNQKEMLDSQKEIIKSLDAIKNQILEIKK